MGQQAAAVYLERVTAGFDALRHKVCAGDKHECANCGAPEGHDGLELRPCSRCKLVSYCEKTCQTQHWKTGGHKERCVVFSDPSVIATQASSSLSRLRGDSEKCTICLEPLDSGAVVQLLGCGHELHVGCVDELRASGSKTSCPICRKLT